MNDKKVVQKVNLLFKILSESQVRDRSKFDYPWDPLGRGGGGQNPGLYKIEV